MKYTLIGLAVAGLIIFGLWAMFGRRTKDKEHGCVGCNGGNGGNGNDLRGEDTQVTVTDPTTGKEFVASDFNEDPLSVSGQAQMQDVATKVAINTERNMGYPPGGLNYTVYDRNNRVRKKGRFRPFARN